MVLVAAGRFTHIGGVWTGGVAYWDGAAWHSFGWGINGPGMALAVWDPDGPGPQTPQLIVGGNFTHAGAASTGQIDARGIARWDGTAWRAMGDIHASSFAVVNAQGNNPRLYAGGAGVSGVKHWDGASWQDDDFVFSVPTGYGSSYLTYGIVSNMMEWDPDGPGPLPSSLYVSGRYSYYVPPCGKDCGDRNATVMVIARHDETAWTVINQSHDAYVGMVQSILPFDPDSSGPAHSGLIAGGSTGPVVLALQSYSYPLLDQVPTSLTVYTRETASFSVHCPDTTVSYAWYRYQPSYGSVLEDYQLLADGPTLTGSVITGSSTGTLTIAHASPAHLAWPSVIVSDVTSYRCVITDLCGRTHAVEVALNVLPGSCTADFNHDGDVGTDQDIEAFFSCLAGHAARCRRQRRLQRRRRRRHRRRHRRILPRPGRRHLLSASTAQANLAHAGRRHSPSSARSSLRSGTIHIAATIPYMAKPAIAVQRSAASFPSQWPARVMAMPKT